MNEYEYPECVINRLLYIGRHFTIFLRHAKGRITRERKGYERLYPGVNAHVFAMLDAEKISPGKPTERKIMTATQQREAHHAALSALYTSLNPKLKRDGLALWRVLACIEREAHAGATAYCNGEKYFASGYQYDFCANETDWDRFTEKITDDVRAAFGGALPPSFFVNGDARGYALKLAPNDTPPVSATPFKLHSDCGSNQILAPTIE